jgi:hypothetical protein
MCVEYHILLYEKYISYRIHIGRVLIIVDESSHIDPLSHHYTFPSDPIETDEYRLSKWKVSERELFMVSRIDISESRIMIEIDSIGESDIFGQIFSLENKTPRTRTNMPS